MVVYYSQILNKKNKKLLSGEYSSTGAALKENKTLLIELKQVLSAAALNEDKIYTFTSKSGDYTFFFKTSEILILAAIADSRFSSKDCSKYFADLSKEFLSKYSDVSIVHYEFDDSIKKISDVFNRRSNFIKGAEELESAHGVLVENLDSLINRGESINNLKDLADKVNFETREMSKRVSQMKRNAQFEQYKIYGIIGVVLLVIIYLFFFR